MKSTITRCLAITAAALLAGTGTALAAAAGPYRHGGGDVATAIAKVKSQLALDTSQQAMWDSAVAAGKSARSAMRINRDNVRSVLNAELAKAEPDLAAVAAAEDQAQTQAIALRHQVRDAWLGLYATFTPDQKAVVKTALQNHLARIDQWRAKMQQRHAPGQ